MLRLANIMTRDVVTTTPEMTLREAAELFATHHISGAPVLSGSRVLGVVSAADILNFAASARGFGESSSSDADPGGWTGPSTDEQVADELLPSGSYFTQLWSTAGEDVVDRVRHPDGATLDLLDDHTVDEIMSRRLVMLSPNDDILRAATLMEEKAIHRVIVVDRGELVGIVSTLDIVRAVVEHSLSARWAAPTRR